jgi:hypothetical protein
MVKGIAVMGIRRLSRSPSDDRCSIDIRAFDVLIFKAISGPDTPGLNRSGPR